MRIGHNRARHSRGKYIFERGNIAVSVVKYSCVVDNGKREKSLYFFLFLSLSLSSSYLRPNDCSPRNYCKFVSKRVVTLCNDGIQPRSKVRSFESEYQPSRSAVVSSSITWSNDLDFKTNFFLSSVWEDILWIFFLFFFSSRFVESSKKWLASIPSIETRWLVPNRKATKRRMSRCTRRGRNWRETVPPNGTNIAQGGEYS